MSADLRDSPRSLGRIVAWIGERLEIAGIRMQDVAAELAWRKWRAMRRWGA